jgi:hypothetical protein
MRPTPECLPLATTIWEFPKFSASKTHGLWPCDPDRLSRSGEPLLGNSRMNREKFGVGVAIGVGLFIREIQIDRFQKLTPIATPTPMFTAVAPLCGAGQSHGF